MPSNEVFDRELALRRCYGSEEMLRELAGSFLCDMDLLLPQIRAALDQDDLDQVGRLGHRLKGTLLYLGAEAAMEAAARVEQFAKQPGSKADANEAVQALQRQCEALKAVLTEQQKTVRPADCEES